MKYHAWFCLFYMCIHCAFASPRLALQTPVIGVGNLDFNPYQSALSNSTSSPGLQRREKVQNIVSITSTCGYSTGDANQPRTANPGFDCTIDYQNSVWGFCPTTVVAASDCALAVNCIDSVGCAKGCGLFQSGLQTATCTNSGSFCSTDLLTIGPDSTYAYIGCGPTAATHNFLAVPTTTGTPESTSSKSHTASRSKDFFFEHASPTSSSTTNSIAAASALGFSSSAISVTKKTGSTSSSGPSTGAIAGGVIGGVVFVVCLVFGIILLRRLKKPISAPQSSSKEAESGGYGPNELSSERERAELPGQYADRPVVELSG